MKKAHIRKIYGHCIGVSESDEKFLADALDHLAHNLYRAPVKVTMVVEKLPESLAAKIHPHISEPEKLAHIAAAVAEEIDEELAPKHGGFVPGLLIFCQKTHPLAKSARKANPSAQWGATCGRLAVVWARDNEKVIWHEALHILGVSDCYNGNTLEGTCEKEPGCIMQYAPTDDSVADCPDCLCRGTADRLQSPDSLQRSSGQVKRSCIWKVKDSDSGLYRYTRYDSVVYECLEAKDSPLGRPIKNIDAWHSKLVPRETRFEVAAAESASFRAIGGDSDDCLSAVRSHFLNTDGTSEVDHRKTQFDDGSYITEWFEYWRSVFQVP